MIRVEGSWCHFARIACVVILLMQGVACVSSATAISVSPARSASEVGMVDAADLVSGLVSDMRYATANNFVGAKIDGYLTGRCLLHRVVAQALARVQQEVQKQGYRLVVFDCYRPTVAVSHFVRWVKDLDDQKTKSEFYPKLDKTTLLGDYIAERSGHSRGATVDLSLQDCRSGTCVAVEMGTAFDFFDERANTESKWVSEQARGNRLFLRSVMTGQGFQNYPMEWWHYSYRPEPTANTEYAFAIE